MGVVKAMAPMALGLLVATFLVWMTDMSRLAACCGHRSRELQERVVQARYLLVRTAPVAAGTMFYGIMADDDLRATGPKLLALFMLGDALSFVSSLLALAAVYLELSCDCVVHYWLAVSVAFAATRLVGAWVVCGRIRARKLRRAI